MTQNDIGKLSEALNNRGNKKYAHKLIAGVLHNKSCKTLINEWAELCENNSEKTKRRTLLILVLAILYKDHGKTKDLQKVLESSGLTRLLYGELCILFGGRNSKLSIKTDFSDGFGANIYYELQISG